MTSSKSSFLRKHQFKTVDGLDPGYGDGVSHNVFVISTGRTGTTFLADTLNKLGAQAAHEPGPGWLRLLSNAYVAGDISHERTVKLVRKVRPPVRTWDVEASCLVYGLTRPILDAIPEARIVHLIRDPRTYVQSAMNWGVHRPGGRPLNMIPYRRLTPPQIEGRSPKALMDWTRRDQFSRICWTWHAQNSAIRRSGRGDKRFSTVRMEDLFDSQTGYTGFLKILDLAGIPAPSSAKLEELLSRKINQAPRQRYPRWKEWPSPWLEELVRECGDLAEQYGYQVKQDIGELLQWRSDLRHRAAEHRDDGSEDR